MLTDNNKIMLPLGSSTAERYICKHYFRSFRFIRLHYNTFSAVLQGFFDSYYEEYY